MSNGAAGAGTAAGVLLRDGALYLPREIYDRYFAPLETVILLHRDGRINVLPVKRMATGGYFLKRRNAHGDRVIDAPDFFREQGFDDAAAISFAARWNAELSGLTLGRSVTT